MYSTWLNKEVRTDMLIIDHHCTYWCRSSSQAAAVHLFHASFRASPRAHRCLPLPPHHPIVMRTKRTKKTYFIDFSFVAWWHIISAKVLIMRTPPCHYSSFSSSGSSAVLRQFCRNNGSSRRLLIEAELFCVDNALTSEDRPE